MSMDDNDTYTDAGSEPSIDSLEYQHEAEEPEEEELRSEAFKMIREQSEDNLYGEYTARRGFGRGRFLSRREFSTALSLEESDLNDRTLQSMRSIIAYCEVVRANMLFHQILMEKGEIPPEDDSEFLKWAAKLVDCPFDEMFLQVCANAMENAQLRPKTISKVLSILNNYAATMESTEIDLLGMAQKSYEEVLEAINTLGEDLETIMDDLERRERGMDTRCDLFKKRLEALKVSLDYHKD